MQEVRNNLARFQALVPDDIEVSYELDQSGNVAASLRSVVVEAGLGALLTGLMVLLFLRDWRSSAIVVITIPFALLTAVVALWGAGQTINIMTLGGLALAVGILVDEATVAIENIHTHLARGTPVARAVLDASGEVVAPRLLAMLVGGGGVRAVVLHDRRVAVALRAALARGRLRDDRVVPAVQLARAGARRLDARAAAARTGRTDSADWVDRLRDASWPPAWTARARCAWHSWPAIWSPRWAWSRWSAPMLGREIFPPSGTSLFQLRFRAPAGTKFESTEQLGRAVLDEISAAAGPGNVAITLGYVGVQPSSYPINTIFLWTGGSHEGVLQVSLRPGARSAARAVPGIAAPALPREVPDGARSRSSRATS